MKPRFSHLAVIGVCAAALALSGCGRKGPLERPPAESAAETSPKASKPARPSLNPLQGEKTKTASPAFDADGNPIANPNAPKKRLPMDWLLD